MVKSIAAVERAMVVLTKLRENSAMSLAELQSATDINKATLLRLLKTLCESDWVIKSHIDNRYRIARSSLYAERQSSFEELLLEAASPVVNKLQDQLSWPSDIAIRDGLAMRLIETTRNRSSFILHKQFLGTRPEMLYSGVGRCYLAFCAEQERQEIIEGLRSKTNKEARLANDSTWVEKIITKTRAQGYGEREAAFYGAGSKSGLPIEAIAVPIYLNSHVVACLTLAWMQGGVKPFQLDDSLLAKLNKAAQVIAAKLSALMAAETS